MGRNEEELTRKIGSETVDRMEDKIFQQENEQEKSGKYSNDGEKNSQGNYLSNQKDTTDQNIAESEKWESSQMDKGDSQTKDNKEEGDVPNSSGSENGVSWFQDAQHDNIPEENASIWGNEEDINKAMRKSGINWEEVEILEENRKGKNKIIIIITTI